jgi:class 3 adenylate cyclase
MLAEQALSLPAFGDGASPTEAPVPGVRAVTSKDTDRKLATVMFIDVRNSMALSGQMELEDWWSVTAGLFTLMCDGVDHFGGWVGNFTGDGVNAVFEATGELDHHARAACLAALWLRDAIRTPAAELRRTHGLELSVRIGINSGEVLTGTIGHRHTRLHTANGYAVALAKRIEGIARPGRIYLTEHTAALVAQAFDLHDLGAVQVKGARAPVGVFELAASVGPW